MADITDTAVPLLTSQLYRCDWNSLRVHQAKASSMSISGGSARTHGSPHCFSLITIEVLEFATVRLVQDERQLGMPVYFVVVRMARMLFVSNDIECILPILQLLLNPVAVTGTHP